MKQKIFSQFLAFLAKLQRHGIDYTLAHHRDEALLVSVAAPGERWEIEFLEDGSVEVEKFVSSGEIHDDDILDDLFARYAEISAGR